MEENCLVSKPWSRALWGRGRSSRRSSIQARDWFGTVPGRESARNTMSLTKVSTSGSKKKWNHAFLLPCGGLLAVHELVYGRDKDRTLMAHCTMYLTLHSFSLKLCSATIDVKT